MATIPKFELLVSASCLPYGRLACRISLVFVFFQLKTFFRQTFVVGTYSVMLQ